jgi:DNA repair protein RadD
MGIVLEGRNVILSPRPYQEDALAALDAHIRTKDTNPCMVVPTGGGKSALMAWTIQRWKAEYPPFRVGVFAHRKELVKQNADELRGFMPGVDIGINAAGLGKRDYHKDIIYGMIDSVYKRSGEFTPFDAIFVDECHRLPPGGEGKYRQFIKGCQQFNPKLKVIGWTATPFRMGCGDICHKDHILNEICYEAKITDLIHDGFLCPIRSKVGAIQPDLGEVRRNSGGDYILTSLSEATNRDKVVYEAVAEAFRIINAEQRKAVMFFCVDIEHCRKVHNALRQWNVCAPMVTGNTKPHDRERITEDFKAGRIRAICNINVYTEGFNAKNVDCIVLLRPTLSAGLFAQMVGRGLRLHPAKRDCLVLDFGGCIEEHGPIDLLGGRPVSLAVCGDCREAFSRAIKRCPICGWEIPKREVERLEATEREKRLHATRASRRSILSNQPETYTVDEIYVNRHVKPGSPDSLRVQYRCGMSMFREWVCLDHPDYAGRKARDWWRLRIGVNKTLPTVNSALEDMFLTQTLAEWTKTITVRKNGRHHEVVDYNQPVGEGEE